MVKEQIASYIVKRKLKKKLIPEISFNRLFRDAVSILIIMPGNESDFYSSMKLLKIFDEYNKDVILLTHDFKVSLLPIKFKSHVIDYGLSDISRLQLPSRSLTEKLKQVKVNVVIDMNRDDNIFYSYSANLVNSPLRIGVKKKNSDLYYNLQFVDYIDNSEIFYENFLHFLQMF